MGILDSIFGNKENKKPKKEKQTNINWIPLTSLDQLNEINEQSKTASVLLFKHSTRCGISSMVIKQFENLFLEEHKKVKVYYLDLLNYRDISNEIGVMFQVMHQSPQLIIVKNGVAVYNASHSEITAVQLSEFM